MASTRSKSAALYSAVLAAVLLCAFAFADRSGGRSLFIFNHHYIWLKLVLSCVLPLGTALLCLFKTKNARPLSAMMLLVQPAYSLFTIVFNDYYIKRSISNLSFHYAYGLIAFFSVYIAAVIAANRKKITHADFELFSRRFFAGYLCVFLFLFVRLFYTIRINLTINTVNLIPFAGEIRRTIELQPSIMALVYTAGNVLFFSSFSLLLWGLLGSKIKSRAGEILLLIGVPFAVSVCCEITEYFVLHGDTDIDDVILNTSGAVIGYFAAKYIKKLVSED